MSGSITNDVQYMQAIEEYSRLKEYLYLNIGAAISEALPNRLNELRKELEDYEARQRMGA